MTGRKFTTTNCKLSTGTAPMTLGIVAESGQGKTCSALRLATGIQRVKAGKIVYVDTEGGRALEFKRQFDFEHMTFEEPYGSIDYCEALDAALKFQPACVVVDSLTHEHDGAGSYMDLAQKQTEQGVKGGANFALSAGCRRKLISKLLTYPATVILCMRAKMERDWEAVFKKTSKEPTPLGYGAIGGAEFVYMMTARFLLLPEPALSPMKGAPVWDSKMPEEVRTMKLGPFASIFSKRHQLCEDDGEAMARWYIGNNEPAPAKETWSANGRTHLKAMASAVTLDALAKVRDALAEDNTLTAEETQRLDVQLLRRDGQLKGQK